MRLRLFSLQAGVLHSGGIEMSEEAKERGTTSELIERVWSQALLAVSTAEEEATQLVNRLGEIAGWDPAELRARVRELAERLEAHRRELEGKIEDAVEGTAARLRLPRREELSALHARLDELARRIDALRKSS